MAVAKNVNDKGTDGKTQAELQQEKTEVKAALQQEEIEAANNTQAALDAGVDENEFFLKQRSVKAVKFTGGEKGANAVAKALGIDTEHVRVTLANDPYPEYASIGGTEMTKGQWVIDNGTNLEVVDDEVFKERFEPAKK